MAVLLVATAACIPLMPQMLFPDMEYDQLYMEYKLPDNCSPDRVKADLEKIREELMQMDDVVHVTTSIGGTPGRYNLVRSAPLPLLSYGELIIDFRSNRSLERHVTELQRHFSAKYPDAFLVFKRYNLMFMRYPIELRFCGPDPAVLHQLADSALALNRRLGIITPVTTDWAPRVPMLVVDYDQARARDHGISRSEAGFSLLSATDGLPVGCYYDGTMAHKVYLSLTDQQGQPLTELSNATVFSLLPQFDNLGKDMDVTQLLLNPGQVDLRLPHAAQLSEIGDNVHIAWEDPVIPHYNGERIHSIMGYPAEGMLTEQARAALEREIGKWSLSDGYSIQWGGEKYASDLSIQYLFAPYPLVFLIMLGILVGVTRRFRTSLLLICCVPFVFVGIIPAVLLTGTTFNFVSIVGTLGLVGMILKNGIVLVDEIQLQQSTSLHPVEAVISASMSRLRPVTLASLTTVLGMVPLLFDDMFSSMASTIMGGLIAGTVIVLVFIPVLYAMFFKLKEQDSIKPTEKL
jgi:multidrug efflux pump subunit AcrB